MEAIKKLTHVTIGLLLSSSLSYAGWKNYADSQVAVQTTNATSLKTSLTNSYSGGGARVQWKNLGNISLIHAETPKFSVGCNGVEIGFGSISFLDFDNLVQKLKLIASQAPAFAFKMAIDTACSQCSTIMQDIEEVVEAINNFSLDACGISENIGNSIGESLASSNNSRYSDSYAAQKARNSNKKDFNINSVTDMINSWSDTVNGKSLKLEKVKAYGSFLNNLRLKKIPTLNGYDPKDYVQLTRSLVGDVVGYMDQDNDMQDTYVAITPIHNINDLVELLIGEKNGVFKKTTVDLVGNTNDWSEVKLENMPKGFEVTFDASDIIFSTGTENWTYKIEESIKIVLDKLKADESLASDDLLYLQALPYNGVRILNHFAMKGESPSLSVEDYAKYIALENVKFQMTLMLDFAFESLNQYINELKKISTSNQNIIEKYNRVLDNVKDQKLLLRKNEYLLSIPTYKIKIDTLLNRDIPQNRRQTLQ